jgi:hypothetical protein
MFFFKALYKSVSGVSELGFKRYKYVVQVVLGEQHGAGVKIGSRCLWDADTDNYASGVFINVSNNYIFINNN